jgi:nanoRNase/pAp phosphatase (c-di-AMP/oligoRNAs hydrolase)
MRPEDMVNLAVICERYGGGGHARVGAISFEPNQEERARQAAKEIAGELRASVARVRARQMRIVSPGEKLC